MLYTIKQTKYYYTPIFKNLLESTIETTSTIEANTIEEALTLFLNSQRKNK